MPRHLSAKLGASKTDLSTVSHFRFFEILTQIGDLFTEVRAEIASFHMEIRIEKKGLC